MGTHRERFLDDLATLVTFLTGEARIDSSHAMPGSFSLVTEDVEECAPTGVHDALRDMMVLDHVRDLKVFNCNQLIALGVRFRRLEMVITALAFILRWVCATFFAAFRRHDRPACVDNWRCLRLKVFCELR